MCVPGEMKSERANTRHELVRALYVSPSNHHLTVQPNPSPAGMAKLLDLPKELLLEIAEGLEGDNLNLASLCLTSRACAYFSKPSLYRCVKIRRENANRIQIALLLRTALDRPDLIALTKVIDIETSIFRDLDERLEVPSGATRMRLESGLRLEDAALDCSRRLERSSPSGVSSMIRLWRSDLRNGAQAAYLGVLLSLLTNVNDISITIYTEEGEDRKTVQPLERLFGLSVGGWDDEKHMDPRPHLPLLPSTRNVTRLKISGANMALLGLGFEGLEILEADLTQTIKSRNGGTRWTNELVNMDPFLLPKVHTVVLDADWYCMDDGSVQSLFDAAHFPQLLRIQYNMHNRWTVYTWHPYGTFTSFLEIIGDTRSQLQEFTINVVTNLKKSNPSILSQIEPFDPIYCRLKHFERLHTVYVPSSALVHHYAHANDHLNLTAIALGDLPPNLTHLTILYPKAQTLEWIRDTFVTAGCTLQTLTLSCAWEFGKSPSWFERRRAILDDLPCRVIVNAIEGQKEPEDYSDGEAGALWDEQQTDGDWLAGLFEHA
ncbi:hypothetical protein CC86DRAFT_99338 [Ophiobolus disseminans]|uniref:F-box domain-containing protein n=1 Tax=Ophiobolus disseminans TaxID=1469910 RepID=A0A6A6ZLD2_9PLEO|nr:hypothetical protein CC86DRAFT_99338 [Ophiobolus disseminans]